MTQSCLVEMVMNKQIKNLIGQKFGRLTVLEYKGNRKWLCRCDCGNEKIIGKSDLTSGKTKSCGCYHKEQCQKLNGKHYSGETKLYKVWEDMKRRCINPKHHAYKHYGDRGIVVCNEWREDFLQFKAWAISNGYKEGLSIDRINVNGNYEPSNCRWVTWNYQCRNRRNNVLLTYQNKTQCVTDWAIEMGLKPLTLAYRIRVGWDVEKALTTEVTHG